MGLADPASHGTLLDRLAHFMLRQAVFSTWRDWRGALAALAAARERIEAAARDEEWLRHAVDELARLAPMEDEEERLAAERQRLQQGERRAEAVACALAELAPGSMGRDRRGPGPAAALRSAARVLQRLIVPGRRRRTGDGGATAALERAEEALAEAEVLLGRLAAEVEADPRLLEKAEERLFALRAASRKHGVAVRELAELLDTLAARLAALDTGAAEAVLLEAAAAAARAGYVGGGGGADGNQRAAQAQRWIARWRRNCRRCG